MDVLELPRNNTSKLETRSPNNVAGLLWPVFLVHYGKWWYILTASTTFQRLHSSIPSLKYKQTNNSNNDNN